MRIDELEIVELYRQRAEDAARVVRDIDRYLPVSLRAGATLLPAERLVVGEGGRPAAPTADYGAGMWRRLIVTGPEVGDGGRSGRARRSPRSAPAPEPTLLPHVVDNRLVGQMVRDAVASARVDGSVNVALFELLLPNDLKRELASIENLVLVVDDETADIPWEALADRSALTGPEPFVKRMGLVRQLKMIERPAADTTGRAPPTRSSSAIHRPAAASRDSPAPVEKRRRSPTSSTDGRRPRRSLVFDDERPIEGAAAAVDRPAARRRLPDPAHRRTRMVRTSRTRRRTVGRCGHRTGPVPDGRRDRPDAPTAQPRVPELLPPRQRRHRPARRGRSPSPTRR